MAEKDAVVEDGWTKIQERTASKQAADVEAPPSKEPWYEKDDWRQRTAADVKSDAARFAGSSKIWKAHTGKYTCTGGPSTRAGVKFADQVPGTIIFRPDIRPYKSDKIPDTDERILYKDNVRYLVKGRYWLIVKTTRKNVWEVPIYTNGNTGVRRKNRNTWWEYFSLRPFGVGPKGFHNQSPDNRVFSVGWVDEEKAGLRGQAMRLTMVVHFTEVHKRAMDHEDVRIVAALTREEVEAACAKAEPYVKQQL